MEAKMSRMFALLSECLDQCQDVLFLFSMYSSLSGCVLPGHYVYFPVRVYYSLSECILPCYDTFCHNILLSVRVYFAS